MSSGFNLDAYRTLLSELRDRGYECRSYDNVDPQARHLILRHDIDISLDAALPIADIEHSISVKAYYFVLLRTEMYNPFSAKATAALSRLMALGHEVGLHLDASLYDNDPAKLQRAAERECEVLELAVGAPVRFVSFHRPAKSLLGFSEKLAGRLHAYQPAFFSEIGYCSDSRGSWRYGHPLEHATVRDGRALQLLTHPIWWVEGPDSPSARLDLFFRERVAMLDREIAENSGVYRSVQASKTI
jgi:hypothetical protein